MAKNTHELLGIAVQEIDRVSGNFDQAIRLLKAIKSGEVDINRLTITDKGWEADDALDVDGSSEVAPEVADTVD